MACRSRFVCVCVCVVFFFGGGEGNCFFWLFCLGGVLFRGTFKLEVE